MFEVKPEEETQGNKNLGPRSSMVGVGVHAGGGELGGQRWFSEAVVRESHR